MICLSLFPPLHFRSINGPISKPLGTFYREDNMLSPDCKLEIPVLKSQGYLIPHYSSVFPVGYVVRRSCLSHGLGPFPPPSPPWSISVALSKSGRICPTAVTADVSIFFLQCFRERCFLCPQCYHYQSSQQNQYWASFQGGSSCT